MKLSRKIICLVLTLLMLLPASWVYADDSDVSAGSDSGAGIETEIPPDPSDSDTEEGLSGQDNQAIEETPEGDASAIPAEDISKESTSQEEEKEKELVQINDEKVPLAPAPTETVEGAIMLDNLFYVVLVILVGGAIVTAAVIKSRKKETFTESNEN